MRGWSAIRPRALTTAAAAVAGCVMLSACGSGGGSNAPSNASQASQSSLSGQTITLYNGQHEQATDLLVKAFEKQTGIHVRVHSGDGPQLATQILQEGSASPADVYFTENSPELMTLQDHHLLAPVAASTLAQIPSRDNSPAGDWVGVVARVNVLAYDPAKLSAAQLPSSLLDLAQPAWKGKIAIAPADADFLPLVQAMVALHGTSATLTWLRGLKTNAQIYQDDEGVVAAVNRGSVAAGIINNYYWFRMRAQMGAAHTSSRLHYFSDDAGSLVNVSGAAVLGSSHHAAAAQRFLTFLVSASAQRLLARSNIDFEYPLRPGVSPSSQLKPFAQLDPPDVGVAQLGADTAAPGLLRQASLL